MQILFSKWDILYPILAGAYSTVARIYDVMLKLAGVTSEDRTLELGVIDSFSDITTAIYTIAGIFMLFRVTIAMVNMLINPDMVSDRNAGAGKILTRVITSVAMLIIFIPNGWVFGDNGILNRLEQGLLAEDGIISRIVPFKGDSDEEVDRNSCLAASVSTSATTDTTSSTSDSGVATSSNTNSTTESGSTASDSATSVSWIVPRIFAEDVYASPDKDTLVMDCYYIFKTISSDRPSDPKGENDRGATADDQMQMKLEHIESDKGIVHMMIFKGSMGSGEYTVNRTKSQCNNSSCRTNYISGDVTLKTEKINYDCDNGACEYYLVFDYDYANRYKYPTDLKGNKFSATKYKVNGDLNSCPKQIDSGKLYKTYQGDSSGHWNSAKNHGWVGGWTTTSNMWTQINNNLKDGKVRVQGSDSAYFIKNAPNLSTVKDAVQNVVDRNNGNTNANLLTGVSASAIRISQDTMGSFLQCAEGQDDTCQGLAACSLITSSGNDAIISALDNKTMFMDFMIGLIAAVGIAIWLVIMCVDVIVRRFKLILLQVIAPIPIISYSDPKDKMFGQWAKTYLTVYADLFLKLIAIGFATALLENIGDTLSGKGLLVFFYIVAILVFAKVLPSLLSELFGFKMGNSFKDITGMGKAALGFGAGAVVGGLVGGATGSGFGGRVSGAVRGALRGAGSGSKGDVFGGGKSISAYNSQRNKDKAMGISAFDRMMMNFADKAGLPDYAAIQESKAEPLKAQQKALREYAGYRGKMLNTVKNETDLIATAQSAKNAGFAISDDKITKLAENYGEALVNMQRGTGGYWSQAMTDQQAAAGKSSDEIKAMKNAFNASRFKYENSEYSALFNSDMFKNFDFENSLYNGGVAGNLDSSLKELTNKLKGDSASAQIIGITDANSFADASKIATNAWTKAGGINDIEAKVAELTYANADYNKSLNARGASGKSEK